MYVKYQEFLQESETCLVSLALSRFVNTMLFVSLWSRLLEVNLLDTTGGSDNQQQWLTLMCLKAFEINIIYRSNIVLGFVSLKLYKY